MAEINALEVLGCLDDDSDWNESEEEESDSEEENGRLELFLDYIEQYEVLLSCFYRQDRE